MVLDSNYNHVLVRYAKQIDAEKAIIAIDRSFFFSSWCRGKFEIVLNLYPNFDARNVSQKNIQNFEKRSNRIR